LRDGLMPEPSVDPADLFAHLYAEETQQLREQAAFLRDELAREEA
jgi:pyruvate dehydrogenase E1 component alpha subunit